MKKETPDLVIKMNTPFENQLFTDLKNTEIGHYELNGVKTPGPPLSPGAKRGVTDVISSLLNSPTYIPDHSPGIGGLGSFDR